MKVFTVGLDEKPPLKEHPEPENVTVIPPPVIAVQKSMKKNYKGYMFCLAALFFILFFAIILSERAYYRARDESLRWAELRHRIGLDCKMCNQQRIVQSLYRQNRFDSSPSIEAKEIVTPKTTTPVQPPALPIDDTPKESKILDPRLEFLRQILMKIREQAEKSGIDGTMKVSVIRIDPAEENQDNSILDGFGEVQQPPQYGNPFEYQSARNTDRLFGPSNTDRLFGPSLFEDYYSNEDTSPQMLEILANRRTEMGPRFNGPMEIYPVSSSIMDSSNSFGNSILPWAGTINQGQKTFETFQPIQQPEYIRFLNIQPFPQNNYQPQEQWQSYQPQSSPIQSSQWYTPETANPLWQWQGNQWQPMSGQWNQWQNGIQNSAQQQQPAAVQWPNQQAVNSIQDDNRWQASLQNNQWTVQRANNPEANQVKQQPGSQQWAPWWQTDSKWNNQIVQPQQETPASNAIPVIEPQPISWSQQNERPWTHVPHKTNEASQAEQKVILTSVETAEKPEGHETLAVEPVMAVIPQRLPVIVEHEVPEIAEKAHSHEIPQISEIDHIEQEVSEIPQIEQPSEPVPVVQRKPDPVIEKIIEEAEKPKIETATKTESIVEAKLVVDNAKPEEPTRSHVHDLPELELAHETHEALPLIESDLSEEQPHKVDFPAFHFPSEPLNEASEDASSRIFFQVDEPQPQFADAETFVTI